MFSALAPRYRFFNRCSSLGLDGHWRRSVLMELRGGRRFLDLGSGTGDLSWELFRLSPAPEVVVGVDLSFEMLKRAARSASSLVGPHWVQASADSLPFRKGVFDAVVSAYVLRNLWVGDVLSQALQESSRVLSERGRVVFLDLSRPQNPFLRWGHSVYNRTILPAVGRFFFGRRWPGAYLERSIRSLPDPQELQRVFLKNGFSGFECRPLWGGIVSLFIGKK